MNFGDRLALIRKWHKLSQADLARMIGINKNVYSRYEQNITTRISIDIVFRLSHAFGLPIDYLEGNLGIELDSGIMNIIKEFIKMDKEDRERFAKEIDAMIQNFENKNGVVI